MIRGEFLWSPQTACSLAAGEDFYMQTCFALLIGLSLMVGESSRRDFSVLVRSTTLHLLSWLEQSLEGGHFKRSLSRLVTTGAGPASTLVCSRGPRLRDRAVPDVLFCTQDRLVSSGSLPGPPRLLGTLLGTACFHNRTVQFKVVIHEFGISPHFKEASFGPVNLPLPPIDTGWLPSLARSRSGSTWGQWAHGRELMTPFTE